MSAALNPVVALDFRGTNLELAGLRGELAEVNAKIDEVRAEVDRLAREIHEARGAPVPDAVAAAIMGGATLAEAASTAETAEAMTAQRIALAGALNGLEARAGRLRQAMAEVEGRQRAALAHAIDHYRAALVERQRKAAKEIASAHAGLEAIASVTGIGWIDGLSTSKRATAALMGVGAILGPLDAIAVPAELVGALKAASDAGEAIHAPPATVSTRYL